MVLPYPSKLVSAVRFRYPAPTSKPASAGFFLTKISLTLRHGIQYNTTVQTPRGGGLIPVVGQVVAS